MVRRVCLKNSSYARRSRRFISHGTFNCAAAEVGDKLNLRIFLLEERVNLFHNLKFT